MKLFESCKNAQVLILIYSVVSVKPLAFHPKW